MDKDPHALELVLVQSLLEQVESLLQVIAGLPLDYLIAMKSDVRSLEGIVFVLSTQKLTSWPGPQGLALN
jgi:hypothetical protein